MTHLLSYALWYFAGIKELISAAIIGYHIFLSITGALTILCAFLVLKDYWKCRRYRLEQEHSNDNPNNDVTI